MLEFVTAGRVVGLLLQGLDQDLGAESDLHWSSHLETSGRRRFPDWALRFSKLLRIIELL